MTHKHHTKNKKHINDADYEELELIEETNKLEEENEIEEAKNNNSGKNDFSDDKEIQLLKDQVIRIQADYNNFKMRNDRDRDDMIFYLKNDIFKKIIPRVDDLERIIKNSVEDEKKSTIYEGINVLYKSLIRDLESMGVKSFQSLGKEVDPLFHEVMTQIPSEKHGLIIDEFEKGYMLGERVLRVAKVVVGI